MDRERMILSALLSLLCVIPFLVWGELIQDEKTELKVTFFDVGQGDAVLIEAPNGNQVLIDGGPSKAVVRALGKELGFFDRHIDMVIATHPDLDHIGGLPFVLEQYNVDVYMHSGIESDTKAYELLEQKVSRVPDLVVKEVRRPETIVIDEGVYLEVLFPDIDASAFEANTGSIVTRLVYGETEFLLMGDAPRSIETYLVSKFGASLESDVLKVGHHGSKTSTSEVFVGVVDPAFAIISAGRENRYGHPHPDVLDVLNSFDISVLGTYDRGTITITSDGKLITVD